MARRYTTLVDRKYEDQPLDSILRATPDAIQGVSADDAEALARAFRISTVEGLARSVHFERARALLAATGTLPAFDPGPPVGFAEVFAQAPLDAYLSHPTGRFRTRFGPVFYRGRLDGTARALVLGQDPSSDEILVQRNFVGFSGQLLQGFLRKVGLRRSYTMFNTFLFSINGQYDAEMRAISSEPFVRDYRHLLLDELAARSDLEVVLSVGRGAREALEQWPGRGRYPWVHLTHPAADEQQVADSWNDALPQVLAQLTPDEGVEPDPTPYGVPLGDAVRERIPRGDLPFGVPDWHGTGNTRSQREGDDTIVWRAG